MDVSALLGLRLATSESATLTVAAVDSGWPMQFEMRLQTVVGEFYSEVGYNFNFEKP